MLKFALILFFIYALMLIYSAMDLSKDGIIDKKRKMAQMKQNFNKKVRDPYNDMLNTKVSSEKRKKTEEKYKKAGVKINYGSSLLICFFCGLILAAIALFGLSNPYLAVSAFAGGWNIPGLIANFFSNKRLEKINNQVGMFLRMVIKRYQVLGDFYLAFESTTDDFAGEEPIYSELIATLNSINRGDPLTDALHDLAYRTENKYLGRFADYYEISSEVGTVEARRIVLGQALEQYENHMELSRELKKQLSELSMEAYIMLLFVPAVIVYQCMNDPTYVPFMTTTMMGKIGTAVILTIWLMCFWVINVKLASPVDQD